MPARRVVFGIGNPGPEYAGTRHNVGFEVIDALAAAVRAPFGPVRGLDAVAAEVALAEQPALLVKPLTYVNRCGPILASLREREGAGLEHLLVVVDDFWLPLGRLRLRPGGSDGGHNGLRSLIDHLGTEAFPRLRIGIGDPGGEPAERFVLGRFCPAERPVVERVVARAAATVASWARDGIEAAMGEANRADLDPPDEPA